MSIAGQMRNRIVLQTLGGSTDAGGGQTTSYSTSSTVWAKVENLSGNESVFGGQVRDTANYRFTIRYLSSLTEKFRISYNSKLFQITYIKDIEEGKKKYQEILAQEGVAT
tara:strand:- start:6780 stop:7109 length:330 start_codon:yes stop_codon:yes gene_type:complete